MTPPTDGQARLRAFQHEETWIFYDFPLLFTARRDGVRYLVSWVDQIEYPDRPPVQVPTPDGPALTITPSSDIYLAAPLTDEAAAAIHAGTLAPRDFWTSARLADCWILVDGADADARPFDQDSIPEDWLPTPDASYVALLHDTPTPPTALPDTP